MVKIAYTFVGKGRKRTLSEVINIINDKEAYFKQNDQQDCNSELDI